MGAFTRLFSRLRITSDPNVSTQTSSVIVADTTNASLVIAPNGTGALIASIPDGTATGGNARGTNAVDFQTSRTANSNVASGNNATISGGSTNTASSNNSTVSGGQSNTASTNTHATVVGGQSNVSSGTHSVSGGSSNTASGVKSIALGLSNIASGNDYNVAIGRSNNISGDASIAFGFSNTVGTILSGVFGESNSAAGTGLRNYLFGFQNSSITNPSTTFLIGIGNFAIGSNNSYALGTSNRVVGDFQLATGNDSVAYLRNQNTYGNGRFVNEGSIQISNLIAKRQGDLISAATTVLSLDGTGVTNLIIPDGINRTWNVKVKTVARVMSITGTATGVSVGDSFMENQSILFKKVGISFIVGSSTEVTFSDTSMTTASMAYTVGASQELALTFAAPSFAGGGSVLINIVSQVELVEVAV